MITLIVLALLATILIFLIRCLFRVPIVADLRINLVKMEIDWLIKNQRVDKIKILFLLKHEKLIYYDSLPSFDRMIFGFVSLSIKYYKPNFEEIYKDYLLPEVK